MSRYFTNFPTVDYKGKEVRNITNRSKIRDDVLADPFIYLPYTIIGGEKPENIAELYYGSVDDTWLVLLANNMLDPYYDWPLSDEEFDQYFIDKYAAFSGRTGYDVIRWGQDESSKDNIVYFYKEVDTSITQETAVRTPYLDLSAITVSPDQLKALLTTGTITIDNILYILEG